MPDPAPKPEDPARKPWVPPAVLAGLAFVAGLGLGVFNLAEKIWSHVGPPKLPSVSEEYLMIRIVDGGFDPQTIRSQLSTLTEQVKGLRVVMPNWLEGTEAAVGQAVAQFCAQALPEEVEACQSDASIEVLLGTYAVKSFDPRLVDGLQVDLALLDNEVPIDAYDGFIDGALSVERKCLVSGLSDDCLAAWTGEEQVTDLPPLGPGETLLLPIFLSVQMNWRQTDGDWLGDGLAPVPLRFPARVMWDGRALIAHPRAMHETPSLHQGFYAGRG